MSRQLQKFNRKKIIIIIIVAVGGCTPYVENIVTTVVLYIQQIILYSKTTIQQYLEHEHMKAGLLTGLSLSPLLLDPLLSSSIQHLKLVYSTQNTTHTHAHTKNAEILLRLYKCKKCETKGYTLNLAP